MSPHEQAEPFIESYTKLMHGDTELSSFQKVLEMKVCVCVCVCVCCQYLPHVCVCLLAGLEAQ